MSNKMPQKYRHLTAMLMIFIISTLCFAWVGYSQLKTAASVSKNTIINDDYSVLTQGIADETGINQTIQVKGGTQLYGIAADFHTYNRVCRGTVFVRLLNTDGQVVAVASEDMTKLLDNTFKGFIFDNMQQAETDKEYILNIYTQPESPEDKIALWKSEKTYEGFELTENSAAATGTIALQYITDYTGNFFYKAYFAVALFVIIALEIIYAAIFIKKVKAQTAFALIALAVGLVFSVFTPMQGAPDEYVHIATSYKMSNTLLGIKNTAESGKLTVRACDGYDMDSPVEYNALSFKQTWWGLGEKNYDTQTRTSVNARFAQVFPLLYLPQTLGITLARLLRLNYIPMLLMGRLFNLIMYVAAVYFAIKITPVFKTMLAVCGLLPMALQLAASFSYDTYVLALAFLFTAAVLRLAYGKDKIQYKDFIFPCVVLCLLAPAKTIYIIMGALIFIVPARLFKSKKQSVLCKLAVICGALVFWLAANSGAFYAYFVNPFVKADRPAAAETVKENEDIEAQGDINSNTQTGTDISQKSQTEKEPSSATKAENTFRYPYEIMMSREEVDFEQDTLGGDILANGDSKYYFNISYIIKNIPQTIKLVLNTITTQSGKYLQTLVGTRLGEIIVVNIETSWLWLMTLLVCLWLAVQCEKTTFHKGAAKWWTVLVFFGVAGASVLACITWTPINYTYIFGLQGRYALPALPLLLMAFQSKKVKSEVSQSVILYTVLCTDVLIILNAFTVIT